jgi:hypothetical protein
LIAGMLAGYAIRWPTLAKLSPVGALEWGRNYLPTEDAEEGPVQDIEPLPGGGYIGAASPYEWNLGAFNASSFVTDDLGTAEVCATFTPSELYRSTYESAGVGTDNPKRNAFDVTAQEVTLSLAESALPADYECRTCAAPGYHGAIEVAASGDETTVTWTLGSAATFDVIRGDLDVLLATAGDFDAAMSQPVGRCLANDTTATEVTVVYPSPDPGEGYFYLLRAVKVTCPVGGTYDAGSPSQVGARDEEIENGLWECP